VVIIKLLACVLACACLILSAVPALASETITYSYDALGRLVATSSSGSANNGLSTSITYDPAGNRQTYTVAGAGASGGGGGSTVVVADGSFENPPQSGGYAYGPTVTGVTFTGYSGIAGNGSGWGFPAAPDGGQVAFLQGTAGIAMSVSGLTPGSSYVVRFWIAPRPSTGGTPVTVSFNGTALGTFVPPSASETVTTAAFTATANTGTLSFATGATTDVSSAIDAVVIVAAPSVADGSFEAPAQSGGWAMNPQVAGATFSGRAGVAGNGSAFAFAAAPDGGQVGWLQGWSSQNGTIALNLTGLTPGATYSVRFSLAQRPGYGANPVTVSVGSSGLGTFTPASTSFAQVTTATFTAPAASATLTFTGAASAGDIDTAIDAVGLVPGS
jgi:hypothetical protein